MEFLTKHGITSEQTYYNEQRTNLRSRIKDVFYSLKCASMGHGNDDFSEFGNISSLTSMSKMSDTRRKLLQEKLRIYSNAETRNFF